MRLLSRARAHGTTEQALPPALIEARDLFAGYGGVPVVRALNLEVRAGEIVVILGSNGAGKTTTLLTLAGEVPPISGEVLYLGDSARAPLHRRARNGLRFVTEERAIFPSLTTAENLRLGNAKRERALEVFPELLPLLNREARLLSGGEQQMLTLARALAADPKLLLLDELSLGLAPMIVDRLLSAVRAAADSGVGVLLVEQQIRHALLIADRGYVLRRGRVVLEGSAPDLLGRIAEIESTYLSRAEQESSNQTGSAEPY